MSNVIPMKGAAPAKTATVSAADIRRTSEAISEAIGGGHPFVCLVAREGSLDLYGVNIPREDAIALLKLALVTLQTDPDWEMEELAVDAGEPRG